MLRIRSRMRSRLIRPSARASGAPGHACGPRPKATWVRAFSRSPWNSAGHSNRRGSRFAAPFSSITGVPAGMSTPPIVVDRRTRRKSHFTGLSSRSTSSRNDGDPLVVRPQLVLHLGVLGQLLQRAGEQSCARLLSRREQEGGRPHDRGHVRGAPVRIRRERQVGQDVLARRAPPVLDVLDEPLVEPRQGVLARVAGLPGADLAHGAGHAEARTELLVLGFGHAEEVGDGEHRERLGVRADELAATVGDELVELLVGEAPHERFVVLEPLRRDQPHQQRPLVGVVGRVHRDHVLVHRQLVPVLR